MKIRVDPSKFRACRMRAVLSPEGLSKKSDVSIDRIYALQQGKASQMVREDTANALANAMGCKVWDFAELVEQEAAS